MRPARQGGDWGRIVDEHPVSAVEAPQSRRRLPFAAAPGQRPRGRRLRSRKAGPQRRG